MRRLLLFAVIALLAGASVANENEGAYQQKTLIYAKSDVTDWKRLDVDAARVEFQPVKEWRTVYVVGVRFYSRKYGSNYDQDRTLFNIVIQDEADKVLWQKLVPMSYLPDEPGWAKVETEPLLIKEKFYVTVFPYAGQNYGLEIGYTSNTTSSRSFIGNPAKGFKRVEEKFDWMIGVDVRNTLEPRRTISQEEISGRGFAFYDDGSVDGYATFQRGGALVGFKRGSISMIRDIYFYGKAEGRWFEMKPQFRVYLLDHDLRIITSIPVSYGILAEVPHWVVVDFPDTRIRTDFYILIEPGSRPEYSLQIGYDTSKNNAYSFYGTVGTFKNWPDEISPQNLNWMIRVKVD